MQDCPRCRVINTDSALRCANCLFDFRNPASELPASFWDRFKAFWLDALILVPVYLLLELLEFPSQKPVTFQVTFCLIFWLYFAWMESTVWQATCGKRLVGLRVTNLSGARVSFRRAAGRNFGRVLSSILGIGYLVMFFTKRKQTLHDLMASCMVLRTGSIPREQRTSFIPRTF
jgi:uncharacterized RDD family membrane protein YckC